MMHIGLLTLELRIEESHSLKDKRHVVKSLKDRLRHRFNVSVAEVAFQETWQRSMLAVVTVASDALQGEQLLEAVERDASDLVGPALVGATVEWLLPSEE